MVINDYIFCDAYPGKNQSLFSRVDVFSSNKIVCAHYVDVPSIFEERRNHDAPFVLVTNGGDLGMQKLSSDIWAVCDSCRSIGVTINVSDIPKSLVKWFGTNMNVSSPLVDILPLGICGGTDRFIDKHRNNAKEKLLYSNFRVGSHPERPYLQKFFSQFPWVTTKQHPNDFYGKPSYSEELWDSFASDLSSHKFCLCPQGNGVDTYRMWEALYCGSIPIVKKCPLTEYLSDLHIVVVEDWRYITEEFCINSIILLRN